MCVPVYPYELYEGGAAIPEAENYIRVGWENGLCEKDADPLEPVTRGEAVQILYLARKYGLKTETPEVVEKWKIQNNDGVHLGPFLLEFQKVPAAILEEYVRAGRKGNFLEALKIIKKRIPLPMSVGRVCPRF